jgi:hypothetical protein
MGLETANSISLMLSNAIPAVTAASSGSVFEPLALDDPRFFERM